MVQELETVSPELLSKWAIQRPAILDVRSQGEFAQGHLPGSINIPILDDLERAQVGTCYRQKGQDAAIQLGHQLVSGDNRQRKIFAWQQFFEQNPQGVLTCFRGGLRSKITQQWLQAEGVIRPRIQGGYKDCRQYLIDRIEQLSAEQLWTVISGPTGSGKTHFLKRLKSFWPVVDLENLAHHRGSAFGRRDSEQPHQAVFENYLAFDMMRELSRPDVLELPLAVEDESRLIGRISQPSCFFETLRQSPVVWIDESLGYRVNSIFSDYVLETPLGQSQDETAGRNLFQKYKKALSDIQKRLGGVRYTQILKFIEDSEALWLRSLGQSERDLESNKLWIQALLVEYYDPMYSSSLKKRNPQVLFRGPQREAEAFLLEVRKKNKPMLVRRKATPV